MTLCCLLQDECVQSKVEKVYSIPMLIDATSYHSRKAPYVDACAKGDGAMMRPAFHENATINSPSSKRCLTAPPRRGPPTPMPRWTSWMWSTTWRSSASRWRTTSVPIIRTFTPPQNAPAGPQDRRACLRFWRRAGRAIMGVSFGKGATRHRTSSVWIRPRQHAGTK